MVTNEDNVDTTKDTVRGSVTIVEARCKGCGFCVTYCPVGALEIGESVNENGYRVPLLAYPERCNGCDMCGRYCPDFAIWGHRNTEGK